MNTSNSKEPGIILPGLDGCNPLGFLAALGLFRVISDTQSENRVTLHWLPLHSTWVPKLTCEGSFMQSDETFAKYLHKLLIISCKEHPLLKQLEQLKRNSDSDRGRMFLEETRHATIINRKNVDWLDALSSDAGDPSDTSQLQTVRRDYFVGNLNSIIERTEESHLKRTLFYQWDYADALDNQSLHWDPGEDRRHALQWDKPSGDPNRKKSGGMLGANRLALEAFPFFTLVPIKNALQTVGFSGHRSYDTYWSWPLWSHPITVEILQSLLALSKLQTEKGTATDGAKLRAQGIVAVLRTQRILVGKTPNFTPSVRVL